MFKVICKENECVNEVKSRGWCGKHYLRWWKYGNPQTVYKCARDKGWKGTSEGRFWRSVEKKNYGCWEWIRSPQKGYGTIAVDGTMIQTHRFSWELHNGNIPKGMCVLHKCDNRLCVNPNHLFLGTRGDNNRDREQKVKTMREIVMKLDSENRLKKVERELLGELLCSNE